MNRLTIQAAALATVVVGALAGLILAVGAQPSGDFENPKVVLMRVGNDVGYLTPRNPKYNDIRARLMKRKLLEEFREFISPLRLPKTLHLVAEECDVARIGTDSPHYFSNGRQLVMCYQFIEDLDVVAGRLVQALDKMNKRLPKGITFTKQEVIAGIMAGVMLHELGHALFDILDVPVFGREEDGADQLTAFVALQFSPEVARTVLKGFALLWLYAGDPPAKISQRQTPQDRPHSCAQDPVCAYSDNHGTGSQRMYNTLCLGYGRDPVLFRDFVESGWLPKERAVGCAEEYQLVRWAFERTIMPFIDDVQTQRVRTRNWFLPGETETPVKLPSKSR